MAVLVSLALVVGVCAACPGEPSPALSPEDRPAWLNECHEIVHAYTDETLARFRRLVEGKEWLAPAWNAQGMLRAIHVKTRLTFVLLPDGEFMMGTCAPLATEWSFHKVTVSAFLLSRTECTQAAWDRIGGEDDRQWEGARLPIESVPWTDARAWCLKAGLRLPSESEWEFACLAETESPRRSAIEEPDLDLIGWFRVNSDYRTHRVGEKEANPFGLHDMRGNVMEWCEDTGTSPPEPAPVDGTARVCAGEKLRVQRGAAWDDQAEDMGLLYRARGAQWLGSNRCGFRPAADLPE